MTERTQRQHSRGFATIVSGDGRFRLWISRPAWDGKITCNLGFGLGGRMLFVDAVDRLGYVRVDEATRIDGDLSALTLRCLVRPYARCMERLLEDIPLLMEEHLR